MQRIAVCAHQPALARDAQIAARQHGLAARQHAQHTALLVVVGLRIVRRGEEFEVHAVPFPRRATGAPLSRFGIGFRLAGIQLARRKGCLNGGEAAVVVGIVMREHQHIGRRQPLRQQVGHQLRLRRPCRAGVEQQPMVLRAHLQGKPLPYVDNPHRRRAVLRRWRAI